MYTKQTLTLKLLSPILAPYTLFHNNILTTRAIFTNSRDSFLRLIGNVINNARSEYWYNVGYNRVNHGRYEANAPEFNWGARLLGDGENYVLSILGGFGYNGSNTKNNRDYKLDTLATTIGVYGRAGNLIISGFYLDGMLVFKLNTHEDNIEGIQELKYNSYGIGTNIRTGYEYKFSNIFSIESQLNLSYLRTSIEKHDNFDSIGLNFYYVTPALNLNLNPPMNWVRGVSLTTKFNIPFKEEESIYNNTSDNKKNFEFGIGVKFKIGVTADFGYRTNNGFGFGIGAKF
ncbi:hypothetical protein FACS1894152_8400 [Bacilli bacterium]|nr:hypothetical protein FACS1894152_8400 [Bacilli bacterium]